MKLIPAVNLFFNCLNYGYSLGKLATPKGTINLSKGTNKNESKVLGHVDTQVGMTRYGNLLIRVGCGVIATR
jgi:hypothetical protein